MWKHSVRALWIKDTAVAASGVVVGVVGMAVAVGEAMVVLEEVEGADIQPLNLLRSRGLGRLGR